MLEHSMTVAECSLASMGEHEPLREMRLFFQHALEDQLRHIIERSLGRSTIAFVSGLDTRKEVSIEMFTLEPIRDCGSAIGQDAGGER